MADLKDLASRYGVLKDKLNAQDFEPNDSIIASSLMHPQEAARRAKDAFMRSIDAAGGVPREILDESSVFPFGIAPSIDEQAQAGLDLAGLMQTGAMPFAPASAGGTLGTFIGKNARNWDAQAAKLAEEKLNAGADPAEVWREHLISRMPDKTLFSEISDKDALYHEHGKDFYDSTINKTNQLLKHGRDTASYPLNVQDMLAHPSFYENYPNLEATELRYLPETSTAKGGFGYFADDGDPVLSIHGMLPNDEAKSTMLHELQHAIQRQEGWGQGGSPSDFTRQKEAEHARDVLNWRSEVLARKKEYPNADTNAIENNIIKDYSDMGLINDLLPSREARELATQPYMMYPERYDHTNEFEKLNNLVSEYGLDKRTIPYTPIQGYKRLTGEAQARATQDRLDMDMAQRRENYPLAGGKLSDIPLEDLIYKYAQGGEVDNGYAKGGEVDAAIEDYKQLLSGYPNVEKFFTGLKDAAYRSVPTTEQMRDPNFIIDNAGFGGIIKPKGGNWLDSYLGTPVKAAKQFGKATVGNPNPSEEINNWLEQKLAKYIQNEMGTPEDPIRRIAEEWPAKRDVLISQQKSKMPNMQDLAAKYEEMGLPPEVIASRMANAQRETSGIQDKISELEGYNPLHYKPRDPGEAFTQDVQSRRIMAGYPAQGIAKTDLGKMWEHYADENISAPNVSSLDRNDYDRNPWLGKLNNEDTVYAAGPMIGTGFRDLTDELRKATHPDSNLPDFLRIDPAKLSRVSVPQAVEHVAKINAWRDAERLKEGRNAATVMHKEYPDKGLSWMQMKMPEPTLQEGHYLGEDSRGNPAVLDASGGEWSSASTPEEALADYRIAERRDALQAALKFEGDTMGHCVGQYCDEVGDGGSSIYSLRDRRGEPHVTIETKPKKESDYYYDLHNSMRNNDDFNNVFFKTSAYNEANPHLSFDESRNKVMREIYGPPLEKIVQIKGKQNASPNEKYMPAVQDFVRSKDWSSVGDFENTGLTDLNRENSHLHPELQNIAKEKFGRYATDDEIESLMDDFIQKNVNFAKGGEVSMDDLHFNDDDALRMYHQEMDRMGDKISNTGASKKTGKGTARVNYSTLTKGEIGKEIALHTLMANYGVDVGDLNLDAGLIKPMEADGLYIGDLTGSLPLGEGRASLGVQGIHSKYDDGLSGYTAGYNGKVGDGNLSARYFEPADHNNAGRQVQLEYDMPFAKGGEVKDLHNKYEESDYGYGNRPDKTKKGLGYFGELERPDGTGVMTEYSIGVPINGEEMDVPTLVPTLTPDEIRLILHMQDGEDMPRSIVHKAIDHAHQRLSEGKPIFATEEDLYAHGGIVDVLHNDAIEQIMKAFMDSMEDEPKEDDPAAVSIQITTQSQPLKSGKIPTSIREAKHG